jgi:cell division protein FtsQ
VSGRCTRLRASRYRGNRGFSSGIAALLMLFAIAVAGVAWVSMEIVTRERWPIRWLDLRGSFDRVSAEQLRSSLMPLLHSSFFTIDLSRLRETVERNSWVAVVSVEKQWPDTVMIAVEEHVPVAHWNSGHLISTQGRMFAAAEADEIQGLPWLRGPDEQLDQVLGQWSRFNMMLDSVALEIEQLSLDQRGMWSLELNKGTHLSLGRENAGERLERFVKSWETLQLGHDLPPLSVDLRYTNGFAVQWPQATADFVGNPSK